MKQKGSHVIDLGHEGKSFAQRTSLSCDYLRLYILLRRLPFLRRLENAASCMNSRQHASSHQLCLFAWATAFWSVHFSLAALCRAAYTLKCCVCGRCSTTTCSYILEKEYSKKGHKHKRRLDKEESSCKKGRKRKGLARGY